MSNIFAILCIVVVFSAALSAGLFLVFSDFLMRSFRLSESRAGIEVMQVLNREIFRSITGVLLFGNIPATILLAAYAYWAGYGVTAHLLAGGATSYVLGVLIVSYSVNVPMNEELDRMDCDEPETIRYWHEQFVGRWVWWNWIRALGAGATSLCFLLASFRITW